MRRTATLFLLLTVAGLILGLWAHAWAAPAQAERRVALVIGNGAYHSAPLKNPANDARDMAAALKAVGFEVILRENASLRQMNESIDQFWASLKRGGVGLFFFAGHGLQVRGVNYLVPVDANIQLEQDVKVRCLDVNLVLGRMENAGNPLNLVILDACRNNPFARAWRNAGQGLAKMDAPMGTLIAYATAPDSVAADGAGKNGVYTQHLLNTMRTPGLKVEDVLKQTRIGVIRDTDKRQIPWESSSLTGDFYFRPGAGGQVPPPVEVALGSAPKDAPKSPPAPSAEPKAGDTWTDPVTGMEFVWVPGGSFEMGCGPWAGKCESNEKPVHTVQLSGFWLGKYEVTNGEYRKFQPGHDSGRSPGGFLGIGSQPLNGDRQPVVRVSWEDAKAYAAWLSGKENGKYRLPTEAEWEYAARSGGRPERYSGGNDLNWVAWHHGNSGSTKHAVGTKAPNGLGLYDMSGNAWEWVEDVFDATAYHSHSLDNPVETRGGSYRVVRDGLITTSRHLEKPDERNCGIGFRLARTN